MARIYSQAGEQAPEIDPQAVLAFFEQRAEKAETLGPTRAVIYQDKNPQLAKHRDAAEKALLLPLLALNPLSRVLDAGCGTGRWAQAVLPTCAQYVGTDVSPGLVRVARERFAAQHHAQFVVCPADQLSLASMQAEQPFTHVLACGLFIYLNDTQALRALGCFAEMAAANCRVMLREPVAVEQRLTLKEHFSEDMDQHYHATYRTEAELVALACATLGQQGFTAVGQGDVFTDTALNNRLETKQRWFLWERHRP